MTQFIRFPIQLITSGLIEFFNKSHFSTYAVIDSNKNNKNKEKIWQSWPSLKTIHKESRLDRHTIQVAIKDLIRWGLIKKSSVKRKKGGGYYVVYTVIKEPEIKKPLKEIREKIKRTAWKKQKRDKNGHFTGK